MQFNSRRENYLNQYKLTGVSCQKISVQQNKHTRRRTTIHNCLLSLLGPDWFKRVWSSNSSPLICIISHVTSLDTQTKECLKNAKTDHATLALGSMTIFTIPKIYFLKLFNLNFVWISFNIHLNSSSLQSAYHLAIWWWWWGLSHY